MTREETETVRYSEQLSKRIKAVARRLYSEQRMSGDEMRNAAQELDAIHASIIPILQELDDQGEA